MTNKELFKKFSDEQTDALPFSLHFNWWNEVVVDNWDVAVVANGNQVIAVWPYYMRKRGPWKMITNPPFTPYSGPFILYPEHQKTPSRISFENKVHDALLEQIPEVSEFTQHFHLGFSNSLSFQWKAYEEHRKYTYTLALENEIAVIWEGFRENTRRQIKKAEKTLHVESSKDALLLERLLKETYASQSDAYPDFESALFQRILNYTSTYGNGQLLKATDGNNDHACVLSIYDNNCAYYLIGGAANTSKNSGAMSLLLWKSIQEAKANSKILFNFEGSTVQAIEKFLRGFGGELTSFSRIVKNNSAALQFAKKLKG